MSLSSVLERRIDTAMHELAQIRNELMFQKMQDLKRRTKPKKAWYALSQQVSARWDNVTVLQELDMQREKTW